MFLIKKQLYKNLKTLLQKKFELLKINNLPIN